MKITKQELEQIIAEEFDALMAEANRTSKGTVTTNTREKHATLSGGRFPIFDRESAEAALKLRGHGTTSAEREKIISRASKFAPAAATKAREADKK